MNNKELELWKEKTKGLFHITQYNKFWNYIDTLIKRNKNIETAIEYIKSFGSDSDRKNYSLYYNEIINKVLNILNGGDE